LIIFGFIFCIGWLHSFACCCHVW